MSNKELDRLKVLQMILEKWLKQKEAASQLNIGAVSNAKSDNIVLEQKKTKAYPQRKI